jgi:hypothetical protein
MRTPRRDVRPPRTWNGSRDRHKRHSHRPRVRRPRRDRPDVQGRPLGSARAGQERRRRQRAPADPRRQRRPAVRVRVRAQAPRHTKDTLREVRYRGVETLGQVYRYLAREPGHPDRVVDPVSNVVDQLADAAPAARDGGPDYQWINKKILGFVKSLRSFDVNVVLVGHEKINDGKGGDGKLYPALGGPTLINKLLAEMDIVAHVERVPKPTEDDPGAAVWIGQIQPRDNLVTKDGTDALGDRRIADCRGGLRWRPWRWRRTCRTLPWEDGPREDEPTPEELADAADAVANAPRQPQIEADDSDPANHPPEVEPGPGQFDVGPS